MNKKNNKAGTCQICGCTEDKACYHPDYGPCWWVDESKTLCSHCADETHELSVAAMLKQENIGTSFELEEQYQFYLQKVELYESKMGEVQKKETRQAFIAGVSQAAMFYLKIAEMEEDQAIQEIDNIMQQIKKYWMSTCQMPPAGD